MNIRPYLQLLFTGIIFGGLTIVATYPLFLHFGDSIYGYPGDGFASIWTNWRQNQDIIAGRFPLDWNNLIGAPFGSATSGLPHPIRNVGFLMTRVSNEVIAYNSLIVLGLWLSAFSALLLGRKLWKDDFSAIFCGLVCGFSPSITWSASAHIGLAHQEWIILYLLALFNVKEKNSFLSALFLGGAFCMVITGDYYYGYLMLVATGVFVVTWGAWSARRDGLRPYFKGVKLCLLGLILAGVLSLPWTWRILGTVFIDSSFDPFWSQIIDRGYLDALVLSARPWDYFIPPVDHPIFGSISQQVYSTIHSLDLGVKAYPGSEPNWLTKYSSMHGQLYLGYTALTLAIFGFVTAFRGRSREISDSEKFAAFFLGVLTVVCLWFSMPPEIPAGKIIQNWWPSFPDFKLFNPSYFLYKLFPMFRSINRFGFVAIIAVVILAGLGLRELMLMINKGWIKYGGFVLILSLVMFESLHSERHTIFPPIPEEYQWLKDQPGDFIIAEYPGHFRYGFFYQRIHKKRMINGFGSVPIMDKVVWPQIEDLSEPGTAERLGALGVRYVLVHTADYFGPNPEDGLQWMGVAKALNKIPEGLALVKTTRTAQIFQVTDTSALMVAWPKPGEKSKEPWVTNRTWRWEKPIQRVYLVNAGKWKKVISMSAKSVSGEGKYRVFCSQGGEKEFKSLRWRGGEIVIPDIECPPAAETTIEIACSRNGEGMLPVWSDFTVAVQEVQRDDNLVSNSCFSSDCYWKKQTGWSIDGGVGVASDVEGSANIYQRVVTEPGKLYQVTYTIKGYKKGEVAAYFGGIPGQRHAGDGTYRDIFKAGSAISTLRIAGWGNLRCNVDDVMCFEGRDRQELSHN